MTATLKTFATEFWKEFWSAAKEGVSLYFAPVRGAIRAARTPKPR